MPPLSWDSAQQLLIPTFTIGLPGAVESLSCARIAGNLIEGPEHNPSQELMAQGVANMVVPLFGGLPVTGTIARTVTNMRVGATSLDALVQLRRQLQRRHVTPVLAELNPQPLSLPPRSGFAEDLGPGCIAPSVAAALNHLR